VTAESAEVAPRIPSDESLPLPGHPLPTDPREPGRSAGAAPAVATALYDTIHRRRDVRGQFTGGPLPPGSLERVLAAAHAAPSVGLSQPWDFVIVTDLAVRTAFYDHVQQERQTFAETLTGEAAERFKSIKIDGVLESTVSVVVTYDPGRGAPNVLGRHAIADAGLYSVCLAIENLWLAATAEGLGVGWVSFYREPVLARLVHLPERVRPVAWLCIGPVTHLEALPDLERHGWRYRAPLAGVLHYDRWEQRPPTGADESSTTQTTTKPTTKTPREVETTT